MNLERCKQLGRDVLTYERRMEKASYNTGQHPWGTKHIRWCEGRNRRDCNIINVEKKIQSLNPGALNKNNENKLWVIQGKVEGLGVRRMKYTIKDHHNHHHRHKSFDSIAFVIILFSPLETSSLLPLSLLSVILLLSSPLESTPLSPLSLSLQFLH